jgi:hypothetical protein
MREMSVSVHRRMTRSLRREGTETGCASYAADQRTSRQASRTYGQSVTAVTETVRSGLVCINFVSVNRAQATNSARVTFDIGGAITTIVGPLSGADALAAAANVGSARIAVRARRSVVWSECATSADKSRIGRAWIIVVARCAIGWRENAVGVARIASVTGARIVVVARAADWDMRTTMAGVAKIGRARIVVVARASDVREHTIV